LKCGGYDKIMGAVKLRYVTHINMEDNGILLTLKCKIKKLPLHRHAGTRERRRSS
jgi:hypothetical protein